MTRASRNHRLYKVDLSGGKDPATGLPPARILWSRSYEDRYSDPGLPVQQRASMGTWRVNTLEKGTKILLTGSGACESGDRPFLDIFNLTDLTRQRVWQSADRMYEEVKGVVKVSTGGQMQPEETQGDLTFDRLHLLFTRESPTDPPNFFLCDLFASEENKERQLTFIEHPFPPLREVKRHLIQYKRSDDLPLTAEVYFPPKYMLFEKKRLPTVLWAYPKEFLSRTFASQTRDSAYRFVNLSRFPLYFLAAGYAVIDNAAFPILPSKEGAEPNDTFIPQLVANAEAVIDHCIKLGLTDPNRVAVGGHSYGSFMTANLCANTNLFRAGICCSGAYNRTLTPFGFQREERLLWEAPEVYLEMSPFMKVHKIETPLLIIHGQNDPNPGTLPLQGERLYKAMQGVGAVARFVSLPLEKHGYHGIMSVEHVLWETTKWLDHYVKGATPQTFEAKPPPESSRKLKSRNFMSRRHKSRRAGSKEQPPSADALSLPFPSPAKSPLKSDTLSVPSPEKQPLKKQKLDTPHITIKIN
eukprot:g46382.t1